MLLVEVPGQGRYNAWFAGAAASLQLRRASFRRSGAAMRGLCPSWASAMSLPWGEAMAAHSMPSTFRMRASHSLPPRESVPTARAALSFCARTPPPSRGSWVLRRSGSFVKATMRLTASRASGPGSRACGPTRPGRAARRTVASTASPGLVLVGRRIAPARRRGGGAPSMARRRSGGSTRPSCRDCWRRVRNRSRPSFCGHPVS